MLNGEAVFKSVSTGNYNWLVGVNGFGQWLDMSAPVSFREDGLKNILQPVFTRNGMTIKNQTYDIPGQYDTDRSGGAFFHQSTFNNLLTPGLSMTLGVRLDVEKIKLDYNSSSYLDLEMRQGPQVISIHAAEELVGSADTTFIEFLPKAALKYEWNRMNLVYGSISRGYKSGGFNIQMISDLVSQELMNSGNPNAPKADVKRSTLYKPERSWNYELGIQNAFFDQKLKTNLVLFYMDISGLQLTEFLETGAGRKLTNAGTAVSKGLEVSADMKLSQELNIGLNYGYAHASFSNYKQVETVKGQSVEVDYSGKFVPYAPQHTANVYLNYSKKLENSFFTGLYGTLSYSGIGKIYWQDSNEISEDFYSLADAVVGVKKNAFGLELWGKNLLNTHYNVFYFESFGNKFFQQGKPLQVGARLTLEI